LEKKKEKKEKKERETKVSPAPFFWGQKKMTIF
jgi:hypothetical protein